MKYDIVESKWRWMSQDKTRSQNWTSFFVMDCSKIAFNSPLGVLPTSCESSSMGREFLAWLNEAAVTFSSCTPDDISVMFPDFLAQRKQEDDSTVEQVQCISCGKHVGRFSTDESRIKFARHEVYYNQAGWRRNENGWMCGDCIAKKKTKEEQPAGSRENILSDYVIKGIRIDDEPFIIVVHKPSKMMIPYLFDGGKDNEPEGFIVWWHEDPTWMPGLSNAGVVRALDEYERHKAESANPVEYVCPYFGNEPNIDGCEDQWCYVCKCGAVSPFFNPKDSHPDKSWIVKSEPA